MIKKILCVIVLMLALVCVLASCGHEHNFGEWETTKVATCIQEGSKERYCSCGEIQISTISKVEHNYVDGICASCGTKDPAVNIEEMKYKEACGLIESGDFEEAYIMLNEITNYEPAKEKLENFFYAPGLIKEGNMTYTSGSSLGPQMKYEDVVYSYDKNGNILSITILEYNDTYNYTYDSKGNELTGYPIDSPNSYNGARTCNYKNGKLSKISYSNSTDEYFYNADGTLSKIVHTYQSESYATPSVYETIYTYTYYSDNTVKTMRYVDGYEGYEYQYDTNGNVIKVAVFDTEFSEYYGYYSINYGDYGVQSVNIYITEYSESDPVGEITYTYDNKGRLTEVMCTAEGELQNAYLLSDYKLCYSENANTKNRISIINKTAIDSIVEFFS